MVYIVSNNFFQRFDEAIDETDKIGHLQTTETPKRENSGKKAFMPLACPCTTLIMFYKGQSIWDARWDFKESKGQSLAF